MTRLLARIVLVLCICVAICITSSVTFAGQQIDWESLLPKLPPLKDPLAGLTQDQKFDVETIQWARNLRDEEKSFVENQQGIQDAKIYERQFTDAGINVDELLAKYETWMVAVAKRQQRVNEKLDGKTIRMAGYLLPLEFSNRGVNDFLLVPYVGACIHVPPPPANQIVFVRLTKKFRVADLFTAVWINGTIRTRALIKNLTLVDGSADISVGYHINGGTADIYRE